MKTLTHLRRTAAALLLSGAALAGSAQCRIQLMTQPVDQAADIPTAVNEQLMTRFVRVLTAGDIAAGTDYSPFFITGRFSTEHKDVTPGPPATHVIKTALTIYIGDLESKNIYTTYTVNLRGVGSTEERAYINALKGLNGADPKLKAAVAEAGQKIIDYYDTQYPAILTKARRAAAMRRFDEALMYAGSIPECSQGFAEASKAMLEIYSSSVDYQGRQLLQQARAAWAESPDADGAATAHAYLADIDPDAACFGEAQALMSTMQKTIKADRDFELKTKYQNAVDLERRRIEAARAIGVAYGNNQKTRIVNNWVWVR